jgi:hypothetical protein
MDLSSGWTKFMDFCRWVYDNIVVIAGAVLLLNTLVFFSGKSGVVAAIFNLVVIGFFGARLWNEYKSTDESK